MTGSMLGLRFPTYGWLLFVTWMACAALSLGLFLVSTRASHRTVVPLTIVFAMVPAVGLLVTAIEPRALLAMASGFTMLPVAVPLFLPWPRALRTGWLLGYTAVLGGVTVATGFGHLDVVQRMDLASNVLIGSFIGWSGGELVERLRERSLAQEVELRRLNRELLVNSTTDALTGLSNRRQLDTDLQMLGVPQPTGERACAFIMLDLDHFKRLNDELGHAVGDAALRAVATELRRTLRGRDTIYRYGGEEFLVIMPDATIEAATRVADRMRTSVSDLRIRAAAGAAMIPLTISGGVALTLEANDQWEAVLAAADWALYEAKASGRDRVCVAAGRDGGESPIGPRDRRRSARPPQEPLASTDLLGEPTSAAAVA